MTGAIWNVDGGVMAWTQLTTPPAGAPASPPGARAGNASHDNLGGSDDRLARQAAGSRVSIWLDDLSRTG